MASTPQHQHQQQHAQQHHQGYAMPASQPEHYPQHYNVPGQHAMHYPYGYQGYAYAHPQQQQAPQHQPPSPQQQQHAQQQQQHYYHPHQQQQAHYYHAYQYPMQPSAHQQAAQQQQQYAHPSYSMAAAQYPTTTAAYPASTIAMTTQDGSAYGYGVMMPTAGSGEWEPGRQQQQHAQQQQQQIMKNVANTTAMQYGGMQDQSVRAGAPYAAEVQAPPSNNAQTSTFPIQTATASKSVKTPTTATRGKGRGKPTGRRGTKRKRGESEEDDGNAEAGESSDESYKPTLTVTKSGRQVSKPAAYQPLPSPQQTTSRASGSRRSGGRGRGAGAIKGAAAAAMAALAAVPGGPNDPNYILCAKCLRGHSPPNNMIVFCDGCETSYHQWCHDPLIDKQYIEVPELQWFCDDCLTRREEEERPLEQRLAYAVESLAPDERAAYLDILPASTMRKLLLRALEMHPDLPIFTPHAREAVQRRKEKTYAVLQNPLPAPPGPPDDAQVFIGQAQAPSQVAEPAAAAPAAVPPSVNQTSAQATGSSALALTTASAAAASKQNDEESDASSDHLGLNSSDPYFDYANRRGDPPATYPRPGRGPVSPVNVVEASSDTAAANGNSDATGAATTAKGVLLDEVRGDSVHHLVDHGDGRGLVRVVGDKSVESGSGWVGERPTEPGLDARNGAVEEHDRDIDMTGTDDAPEELPNATEPVPAASTALEPEAAHEPEREPEPVIETASVHEPMPVDEPVQESEPVKEPTQEPAPVVEAVPETEDAAIPAVISAPQADTNIVPSLSAPPNGSHDGTEQRDVDAEAQLKMKSESDAAAMPDAADVHDVSVLQAKAEAEQKEPNGVADVTSETVVESGVDANDLNGQVGQNGDMVKPETNDTSNPTESTDNKPAAPVGTHAESEQVN